jgi:hypothetical protein
MEVLAGPSRDRHEAGTGQLRRPWYFAWALGGRSSGRGSAKHGGEDRAEPDVAPDGAGRQGFSELHVLRPAPQVNVVVTRSLRFVSFPDCGAWSTPHFTAGYPKGQTAVAFASSSSPDWSLPGPCRN